jgi:hypothetical protein
VARRAAFSGSPKRATISGGILAPDSSSMRAAAPSHRTAS